MEEQIYFPGGETATDIKQLLKLLYPQKNGPSTHPTYYCSSEKSVVTYKDPAHTQFECKPAYRSFGALLIICNTYFPGTTEKELIDVLYELYDEGIMMGLYCHNISRIVFRSHPDYIGTHGHKFICRSLEGLGQRANLEFLDMYTAPYLVNLLDCGKTEAQLTNPPQVTPRGW